MLKIAVVTIIDRHSAATQEEVCSGVANQCRCVSGFSQIVHEVDGTLNGLWGEGPHRFGCTVTEFGVQLRLTERSLGRARGAGRFQAVAAPIRAPHHDARPASWGIDSYLSLHAV